MINFIDILVLVVLGFFVWQGWHTGLVAGVLNLLTTVVALLSASFFYPLVGAFLSHQFKLGENIALVVGFFLILVLVEIVLGFVVGFIYKSLVVPLHLRFRTLKSLDKILGVIPASLAGGILVSLFLLLFLILPINESLREATNDSWWGKHVLVKAIELEPTLEKYLNRLPYKNLIYLLTPSPGSEESVKLSLPADISLKIDTDAESKMFDLVNQERAGRGIKKLKTDSSLTQVGRAHCTDMFKRSYFSHYTPEGKSPFDRMKAAGIDYTFAGENLAYAPNVEIAHQGLMNSPGHRENILRAEFGHLGVAVIDGGIYGEMFCQEFTN